LLAHFGLFDRDGRTSFRGGTVHDSRRQGSRLSAPNSSQWQCSTYLAGRNRRRSTKEDSLSKAKEVAEDWYLQLRGKLRSEKSKARGPSAKRRPIPPRIRHHPPRSAQQALRQRPARAIGEPPGPFFGKLGLSEITPARFRNTGFTGMKNPSPSTASHRLINHASGNRGASQTLKTAIRQGWLDRLPDLSEPYRSSPKISHRAWFSPEEYKQLYEPHESARTAETGALQMGMRTASRLCPVLRNTGVRRTKPGACNSGRGNRRRRSKRANDSRDRGRGKRGVGYCKSMTGAVRPFERLKARLRPTRAYEENGKTGPSTTATKPRNCACETDGSDFSEMAARTFKTILEEEISALTAMEGRAPLTAKAHIYLSAPDGGRRHLPDRQELSHQRRDDRKYYARI